MPWPTFDEAHLKQPIERFEIQLNNFNTAVAHYVHQMKLHKNNINNYQQRNKWGMIHREHVNISRIVTQLNQMLFEMQTLRAKILDEDIAAFDKRTKHSRESIVQALKECLELEYNILPLNESPESKKEEATENAESEVRPLDNSFVQLQTESDELLLKEQQGYLKDWDDLHHDMAVLHEMFINLNELINVQKGFVNNIEWNIEETETNVEEGASSLRKASRYKVAAYPIAGAMLGTCIGGPIGFLAGMKIGGLAAVSCGILGFTGGSLLKKKQIESQKSEMDMRPVSRIEKSHHHPRSRSIGRKKL